MAELAAEDTAVGLGADEQTAVVDDLPTAAAPGRALSLEGIETIAFAGGRTWGAAWAAAAVVLFVGLAVAGAVTFGWWASTAPGRRIPMPSTSSASPVPYAAAPAPIPAAIAAPTPVPPVSSTTTAPPEPPHYTGADARFLASIRRDDLPYTSGDDDAIVSAHQICNYLSDANHPTSMTDQADTLQSAWGWNFSQSDRFVTDAVTAYCPERAR